MMIKTRTVHSQKILTKYIHVREKTVALTESLCIEDFVIQSMPDVSPVKWHLAHVTWFFETFVLSVYKKDHQPFHPDFKYIFNSYYNGVGTQFDRTQRGVLSRPTVEEVLAYRKYVDDAIKEFLSLDSLSLDVVKTVELGIQHEEQHQELLLMDIKHVFSLNPINVIFAGVDFQQNFFDRFKTEENFDPPTESYSRQWVEFTGGVTNIGSTDEGFSFDNERPIHQVFIPPFLVASHLVSNGEYLEFVEAGGYRDPQWWLSAGWQEVECAGWEAPFYWRKKNSWREFTLLGEVELDLNAPVVHLSYYEADAYARFRGAMLPTEFMWEEAAKEIPTETKGLESTCFVPTSSIYQGKKPLFQFYGDVWQWTQSSYAAYPGFKTSPDAVGEYNGKFMSDQYVLRGSSFATPQRHARLTYRNFYPSSTRWQFSGLRLAKYQ